MSILLGLDIGTSRIKSVAYDADAGHVVALANCRTPVTTEAGGYSTHDPEELYRACCAVLRMVSAEITPSDVAAIALSSFGDTGTAINTAGETLFPIMTWYDRRCSPQVKWLGEQIREQDYREITGQRFSTSLGISKWLWILQNVDGAREHAATWLSASDYILWRLTGQCVTDYSIGSRTGLFDQTKLDWSDALLEIVGINKNKLPRAMPSATCVGGVTEHAAQETGLISGTPCSTGGHDHLCAMLLAGQDLKHTLVDSTGTAESLLLPLDHFTAQEELASAGYNCYAHVLLHQYVVRGGLRAAGGAIDWYMNDLLHIPPAELPTAYGEMARIADSRVGKQVRPIWLPHLLGSGTPQNDAASMAAIIGLRAEHDRADVFGGLVESLAFWLRENVEWIEKTMALPIERVVLLGGVTQLEWSNQVKADVLNREIILPLVPEPAAVGAALLAGMSVGIFADAAEAMASCKYESRSISPDPARFEWYSKVYHTAYQPLYAALKDLNKNIADLAQVA